MPSILNLKFKGNKSFVAFSNLNDTESLTKTWKICTKVASYLEQGSRLENLSWRLWHLQNLMVDTDNAKSKREFKKLSKWMGEKLDKEKGRSIEELEAPDFKRNHSTDMIRKRAVEKERNREASQNATPGTIKRMQFTFSVDQPAYPTPGAHTQKPDTKPSAEFTKREKTAPAMRTQGDGEDFVMGDVADSQRQSSHVASSVNISPSLLFPGLFGNDFSPSALLFAEPTLTNSMNYGEGFNSSSNNDQLSISRPTIELALDDFFFNDDASTNDGSLSSWLNSFSSVTRSNTANYSVDSIGDNETDQAPACSTSSSVAGQEQDAGSETLYPIDFDPTENLFEELQRRSGEKRKKSSGSSSSSYQTKSGYHSRSSSFSSESHIPGSLRANMEFPFGYPVSIADSGLLDVIDTSAPVNNREDLSTRKTWSTSGTTARSPLPVPVPVKNPKKKSRWRMPTTESLEDLRNVASGTGA